MENISGLKKITHKKRQHQTLESKVNALRAGVLGSNDGILTVVGVLFSVGAATTNYFVILLAGLADLVACALSMAAGEYASVSVQRDTEEAVVATAEKLLKTNPQACEKTIQNYYHDKGVTLQTAGEIAHELMQKNHAQILATYVKIKYSITVGEYLNPWTALFSSLCSAALGGLFPLVAMTFAPSEWRWVATILAVIVSVGLTGAISAKLGHGIIKKAVWRNIVVGILTMAIHYYLGRLV